MTISPESLPQMSPNDYLKYESSQDIRHELVDGYLYAMTGASDRLEEITLNLVASLHAHLRGSACRAYKGDLKIRHQDNFYYPDVLSAVAKNAATPTSKPIRYWSLTYYHRALSVMIKGTSAWHTGACQRFRNTF